MICEYKKWSVIIFQLNNYLPIIYWLVHDWAVSYSTLEHLNELYNIYGKKANKVSHLKSINKFQSTTNEKFKQIMNKLVLNSKLNVWTALKPSSVDIYYKIFPNNWWN